MEVLSVFISGLSDGIMSGMVLFLIAAGLTLVLGVADILNFAHGALYMLGAYIAYYVFLYFEVYGLALILAPIGLVIVGAFLERFFIRRVYGAGHLYQLFVTYGFILVFDDLMKAIAGIEFKGMPIPEIFVRPPISILGASIPFYNIFTTAIAVAVSIGFWIFLFKTRWGKIIRAGACDAEMLDVVGVNKASVFITVFALGSALAGLGAALAAPGGSVYPGMGSSILIDCFIVVVVGGLGSIKGALVASLLIGLLRSFGVMVSPWLEAAFPFILMVLILLLRPTGLFGRPIRI